MNRRRRTIKNVRKACILLFALSGFVGSAFGTAIYNADIMATLTAPGAQVNQFGFGVPLDQFVTNGVACPTNCFGQATSEYSASAYIAPSGMQATSSTDGSATATAAGGAHAESFARTAQILNLGNLTGSGPPTGPAQILLITLTLTYDYHLAVNFAAPNENALAGFMLFVSGGGANFSVAMSLGAPGTNNAPAPIVVPITVSLPANSVAPISLKTLAYGFADAVNVPPLPPPPPVPSPVPEPFSFVLAGGGLLTILVRSGRRPGAKLNLHAQKEFPPIHPE